MKKVIAIFFVTSLSLLGEEPQMVSFDKLQKRGEDGNQLYYLPDHKVPFTGKEVSYWPDGQKKTEISYKDGKRHGLKAHWYQSGQKLSEINYKYGKHDGLLTVWYENGNGEELVTIWTANWSEFGLIGMRTGSRETKYFTWAAT